MSRFSITDAHRDDGKRFVVHADEKLTAFIEREIRDSHEPRGGHERARVLDIPETVIGVNHLPKRLGVLKFVFCHGA
jgi:hypothetical protein